MTPPSSDPSSPSTYWLGDSYVAGAGATYPGFDDLVHLASSEAGLSDVATDALGGTGYVRDNPAAHFPNYITRARWSLGYQHARPKLIVVGGSINDEGYPEARVKRAASQLYRYLGRALPDAAVVVVPFTSTYPVPSYIAAVNRGVLAAARSAPNVVGALNLPAEVVGLGGPPRAERRSGSLVSSTVKFHPSEAGHRLYGRLIGLFLKSCVAKLNRIGPSQGICDPPFTRA